MDKQKKQQAVHLCFLQTSLEDDLETNEGLGKYPQPNKTGMDWLAPCVSLNLNARAARIVNRE